MSKENIGLKFGEDAHLTSTDEKQVEAFNAFFTSVLIVTTDLGLPGSQSCKP